MMTAMLWLGLALVLAGLVAFGYDDWLHLSLRRRRTTGTVCDHRRSTDEGSESFAAQIRFTADDGRVCEVVDTVSYPTRKPPVGTVVPLVYPAGRPDKARRPRPWLRLLIYAVLLYLLVIVAGRLAGVL